jgi:hypothetical protein
MHPGTDISEFSESMTLYANRFILEAYNVYVLIMNVQICGAHSIRFVACACQFLEQ